VRFLLDTNILIPAEPTSPGDIEATTPSIVGLFAALSQGGHSAIVHPASLQEVRGDRDQHRAAIRILLLGKYPLLESPPTISTRLTETLGTPPPGTHSSIDLLLLSAVAADAVDYFVTEDDGIHRRARRVGLGNRVVTVADAVVAVRALFPSLPDPPPLVRALVAHELDDRDPIFSSFRQDYPSFDNWLAKCKRQHRRAWIIRSGAHYAAICIVNDETPNEYGFQGKTLKICSFKIGEHFRGQRYGELLLKTVFSYLVENRYQHVYAEAFAKHQELFSLLGDFGFHDVRASSKGERVLLKALRPLGDHTAPQGPLEYNVRYGPHALTLTGAKVFVVPIKPRYHDLLFPEARTQLVLESESRPFGNSIRKAYLSHSHIRKIAPGDALLFYRSELNQAVTAIGVAEETLVSDDVVAIARFVSQRTVYSYEEIRTLAKKPVLAVLFRLSRIVGTPWSLDLLMQTGIVRRAPQSFMQVAPEAMRWIANQLGVPH
jgi:hypothetical protein